MFLSGLIAAALVALVSPDVGAALLGPLAIAVAFRKVSPSTSFHVGAGLVTAVVVGAGWLGLGIYQLIREVPVPWTLPWLMLCALVALPTAAARVGRDGDQTDARARALGRYLQSAAALALAIGVLVLVRWRMPAWPAPLLKGLSSALWPVEGAVILRLALSRPLWRRPSRAAMLQVVSVVVFASITLAAVGWRHGR